MKTDNKFANGFSELYVELSIIHSLVTVDAIEENDFSFKHHHAKGFVIDLLNLIHSDHKLCELLQLWIKRGGFTLLKEEILPYVNYDNDYLPHFEAMDLLEEVGIQYRTIKARNQGKKNSYES